MLLSKLFYSLSKATTWVANALLMYVNYGRWYVNIPGSAAHGQHPHLHAGRRAPAATGTGQ